MKKIFSRKFIQKIKKFCVRHKFTSLLILVILGFITAQIGKSIANRNIETRYVLSAVERGTLVTSVTGSGQVSASNQVEIKPKTSGDVVAVNIKSGDEVKAGTVLVRLDARDAQKGVRDAEANMESAKLSLEKLIQPADQLSILQAENSLLQAKESKRKAEDDLEKAYEDGFSAVTNAFLDLPDIMSGFQSSMFGSAIGGGGQSNIDYYIDSAKTYDEKAKQYGENTKEAYKKAKELYDKSFADYKTASRLSDKETIETLVIEAYETSREISEMIKSASNLVQFYREKLTERNLKPHASSETHLAELGSYTSKTTSHLSNLLSIKRTIENQKESIANAGRTIAEKEEAFAKLKAGPDALDIESQKLFIRQRENALLDAKEKLADSAVRAPFDGTVAKLSVKKGDSATTGTSIITFITKQKIAEISLNEIDVAKVKTGAQATLTFDAIEDLSVTGKVVEVETVGTVTQGVVTYGIKISFDAEDERVKAGMSVSTAIITDIKQDVLLVPNSAIKTQGETSYVEMFTSPLAKKEENNSAQGTPSSIPPDRREVEIGLSNDISTEITSGLEEGEMIISRVIQPQTKQATNTTPSLFGSQGGGQRGGNMGGAVRFGR